MPVVLAKGQSFRDPAGLSCGFPVIIQCLPNQAAPRELRWRVRNTQASIPTRSQSPNFYDLNPSLHLSFWRVSFLLKISPSVGLRPWLTIPSSEQVRW